MRPEPFQQKKSNYIHGDYKVYACHLGRRHMYHLCIHTRLEDNTAHDAHQGQTRCLSSSKEVTSTRITKWVVSAQDAIRMCMYIYASAFRTRTSLMIHRTKASVRVVGEEVWLVLQGVGASACCRVCRNIQPEPRSQFLFFFSLLASSRPAAIAIAIAIAATATACTARVRQVQHKTALSASHSIPDRLLCTASCCCCFTCEVLSHTPRRPSYTQY